MTGLFGSGNTLLSASKREGHVPVKLDSHQGNRHEIWANSPARGILHTRVSGHLDLDAVRHLMRCFDLVAADLTPVEAFHDWRGIEGYDTAAREAYARWSMAHRSQVFRVNILLQSRLVAMAVSVARLKLDYLEPLPARSPSRWRARPPSGAR